MNNIGGTEHDELALFPMTSTAAATPAGQTISSNGLCLDAPGGSTGSPAVVATCDGATSQQ